MGTSTCAGSGLAMAAPNAAQDKRVLSIQSHVVAGYVGNKAATFPLQLLGWEVDQVNTVEFSNHTGYGRWGGSKFDAAHLEDVFNALEINGLFRQSRILTGYVPGADALSVVASKVRKLKAANPAITYVLDPVMGDDGRIYVSQAVIPIYKNLLTQATCTTPNYFEAELLTDVKIVDAASLRLALSLFHQRYGIPHVIISAVALPLEQIRSLGLSTDGSDEDAKWLVCAGSSQTSSGSSVAFGLAFPQLAEHYEGVGDVFSSLVTAHFDSPEGPPCGEQRGQHRCSSIWRDGRGTSEAVAYRRVAPHPERARHPPPQHSPPRACDLDAPIVHREDPALVSARSSSASPDDHQS